MQRWIEIGSVVLPVFLCAGLGWLWTRSGRSYDRAMVTDLVSSVGAPALVFHSLVTTPLERSALLEICGAAAAAVLGCVAVGALVLALLRLPAHTYLPPLAFGNNGNLGLAVCALAFPAQAGGVPLGLTLGVGFFAVAALLQFTLGIALWSGALSPRELVRSPLTWSVAAAALALGLGLSVPRWLLSTTEILGGFAIPLMLIALGSSLGELGVHRLPRAAALAVIRLGLGFSVGLALAWLLELEGAARGVVVLQSAMPPAVINWLLADRYRRDSAEVASVVVVATGMWFLAVPLLLAYLLPA